MKTRSLTVMMAVAFITVLSSCSRSLDPEDFVAYVTDPQNGLQFSRQVADYKFELLYRPQELMALSDFKDKVWVKDSVQDRIAALKQHQFYHLRISSLTHPDFLKANLSASEEYYHRVAYYTSFAQEDLVLVQGTDTLNCVMYHFERSYGIQPYHTLILGFDNPAAAIEDKKLIYNDRILGLPQVELEIAKENLKNIPNLSL